MTIGDIVAAPGGLAFITALMEECRAIAEAAAMLEQARKVGLPIIGLMAIPPHGLDAAPYFALLAKMARELGLPKLSMGMSDDFETAVTIGATHVRIGSALFGARGVAA